MTEANDCLHGVHSASDGFAAALWALDYMHWWAAHRMAGMNFHHNPWIPTDTIVPDPSPCTPAGCGHYRVTPKAYGMKAFSLGSQGSVERVAIANPGKVNLTAYAVGTPQTDYVTIINKTHSTTHDAADVEANLVVPGFSAADPAAMVLTDGEPGNAAGMTATLGSDIIRNDSPWHGRWTELSDVRGGKLTFSVRSTTAMVVLMEADGKSATTRENQGGSTRRKQALF